MRLSSYISSLLKFARRRKRRALLTPEEFEKTERKLPPNVLTLQFVWYLQDVPFKDIDAEKVDTPPFCDIAGIRHVLLSLVSEIYEKESKAIIVLSDPGGGKTTFVKKLISMLNEYKASVKTAYVNVRDVGAETCRVLVRLVDELSEELIEIIEVSEVKFCRLVAMLNDRVSQLINSHKIVLIVIDNYDELLVNDYDNAVALMRHLASMPMYFKNTSVVITMTVSNYLRLLKREDFEVITKSFTVVDLRDYYVKTIDDLVKLAYVHIDRYRMKKIEDPEIAKEAIKILNKNPLHPLTKDALSLLFLFYGARTPREYVIVLHDIFETAAKARVVKIDDRFVASYLKTDIPKLQLLKKGLSQGMLLGGFMGIGTAFFVLGILVGKYDLAAYGIVLTFIGFLLYMNAQKAKY